MPKHSRLWAFLVVVVSGACGGSSEPTIPTVEIVVASGDGQFGTAGQVLPEQLQVVVRSVTSGKPQEDVGVRWSIDQGEADFVTSSATLTDESGSSFQTVRLGSTPGEVTVTATVTDQESATASFTLFSVDQPQLQGLSSTAGAAGDDVELTGLNFSPVPEHNIVLFSGIRGRVTASTATQLTVEVPSCLPSRSVEVTVQLGAVASSGLPFAVTGGTEFVDLAPGQSIDVSDDDGFTCLRLPGGPDVSYLATVYSASTVASAQHGFTFRGLSGSGASSTAQGAQARPTPYGGVSDVAVFDDALSMQDRFDRSLREKENELVRAATGLSRTTRSAIRAPAAVPNKGDRRTFSVFNKDGEFEQVEAVAQYVGEKAVLFVEEVGASDFTEADLAAFAGRFDETIFPTVTGAFGGVSDLDGNDRVVILFTKTVNELTPKGSSSFVGGFFFGVDLLAERDGSNGGEVFYSLIPDPNGAFSDPRPKDKLLEVVPGILAHEFQHMVHFNERILELEAEANEALWLSEGLAQMAEELVARSYAADGNGDDADLFRSGNRVRAKRYLADPSGVSLIVASGQGSIEERGAGFLHVLYLSARAGTSVLGQLTRTTRVGVENVTHQAGTSWAGLLSDWWAATYLDGSGVGGTLEYNGLDLRSFLGEENYTLAPQVVGSTDFAEAGSLWSSSARYYIVVPSLQGSVSLRLGGEGGGTSSSGAALHWRIVRLP